MKMNDIEGRISVIFSGGPMNGTVQVIPWAYEYPIKAYNGPEIINLKFGEEPPPIKTGSYKNTGALNPALHYIFEWQGWS